MIIDHLYLTVTLGLNWDIADAKVWWSRPDRAGKLMACSLSIRVHSHVFRCLIQLRLYRDVCCLFLFQHWFKECWTTGIFVNKSFIHYIRSKISLLDVSWLNTTENCIQWSTFAVNYRHTGWQRKSDLFSLHRCGAVCPTRLSLYWRGLLLGHRNLANQFKLFIVILTSWWWMWLVVHILWGSVSKINHERDKILRNAWGVPVLHVNHTVLF